MNYYKAVGSIFDSPMGIFVFVSSLVAMIALVLVIISYIVWCTMKARRGGYKTVESEILLRK